jgi:hypothetical protein
MGHINLCVLNTDDILKLTFANIEVAFILGKKSKLVRNKANEIVHQTFVCNKEGFRDGKRVNKSNRKRCPKSQTRCECKAKMRVHINMLTELWHIIYFFDDDNHTMMPGKITGMMAGHRNINKEDKMQMTNM